jgi:hypothetical protein
MFRGKNMKWRTRKGIKLERKWGKRGKLNGD